MCENVLTILLLACAMDCPANQPEAEAAEAGTLTGQFLYDGELPTPKEIKHPHRRPTDPKLLDESLLVDEKSHGIQNIVVTLFLKPDEKPPNPLYPKRYDDKLSEQVLTMGRERNSPRILALRTGQTLRMETSTHRVNVRGDTVANEPFNDLMKPMSELTKKFALREQSPVRLVDGIFPWKQNYLVITDHPFVAITDEQGKFRIDHLPPGEWTFRVWKERNNGVPTVNRNGKLEQWPKGRVTLTIKPGVNDLGQIKIPAKQFGN